MSIPVRMWSRSSPRRSGRTTALCKAAREICATLVCESEVQANNIRKAFPGLECVSMDDFERSRGGLAPFLYDHFAVERLEAEHQAMRSALLAVDSSLGGLV